MAPRRRRRNKIPEGEAVYECNVLQNGVLVPFPPPPADKGKDKGTAQLDPPTDHRSLGKLPTYGNPAKMVSGGVSKRKTKSGPLLNLGSPADKGKGKAVVEAASGFSEERYPEEPKVTPQLDPPTDHRSVRKLPKYGNPAKMFWWTVEEYLQYDEYLIAKWDIYGFDPRDETYVRIRDKKSKVVRVAREVYNV